MDGENNVKTPWTNGWFGGEFSHPYFLIAPYIHLQKNERLEAPSAKKVEKVGCFFLQLSRMPPGGGAPYGHERNPFLDFPGVIKLPIVGGSNFIHIYIYIYMVNLREFP